MEKAIGLSDELICEQEKVMDGCLMPPSGALLTWLDMLEDQQEVDDA